MPPCHGLARRSLGQTLIVLNREERCRLSSGLHDSTPQGARRSLQSGISVPPDVTPSLSHVCFAPRLCCKTILSMWARNIDSRSRTAKQLRFKSALVPIRLFQNPIPQLLYGDFCNTIPPKADTDRYGGHVRLVHKPTYAVQQRTGYSITSSARASTDEGISKPSALAVLRLITSSYLVGACTGRSAGFSPLRMRST
jgi:hypothetical protein